MIEVKSGHDGFPASIAETLSAFANTPGGGDVVIGLDEAHGFAATGVYDVVACQQALAGVARDGIDPAIQITIGAVEFEGVMLVTAHVPEIDYRVKPVVVKRSQKAYLRQYDGDYPLSVIEVQALIAQRGHPVFDAEAVCAAGLDDLDPTAVARYLDDRRSQSSVLARLSDEEVLRRTGVIAEGSPHPTLAGLLALGIYPQQFYPNLGVQASFVAKEGRETTRAIDSAYFTGPIPTMLSDTVRWIGRTGMRSIVEDGAGGVVDREEYPTAAMRELVANALIHRDLSPYTLDAPITVRMDPTQCVISNPGGLYGVPVEALGKTTSHIRNTYLVEILRAVRTMDGRRVVERMGSGIPTVVETLAEAGMGLPVFHDLAVRFTVRVSNGRRETALTSSVPADLTVRQATVWSAIARAPAPRSATTAALADATGLTIAQVRGAIGDLESRGLISRAPLDGRTLAYSVRR